MKIQPATPEAYQLFHEGSIALAQMEHNGIRVDTDYLDTQLELSAKNIKKMEEEISKDEVWKAWKKRFGQKANLYSKPQLGHILFNTLGYESKEKTDKGRDKTDESVLQSLDLPFVEIYLKLMKLGTARTKLMGIHRETCDGILHPFYNLTGSLKDDKKGGAATYRGSCDSPNFQNFNIRDKILGELLRRAFMPRDGNTLIEIDFGGIEVKIAYCYHKDPTMKSYLLDKSKDMHRDSAAEVYMLDQKEIPKEWWKVKGTGGGVDVRYCGKNQFVFPQFYGDDYMDCSKHLWESITKMGLTDHEGTSLLDVLKSKGIKRLGSQDRDDDVEKGTFEYHIKQIQEYFWNVRFPVYTKWKKAWYDKYQELGWFQMKTGFVCSGIYRRNQVINYPVQGAAFHCLLWVIVELQKWLTKHKMKTKLVGQIHDSILLDAPENEKDVVIRKMLNLMTVKLQEAWPWIIIPLEVEIDTSTTNWHEKQPYTIAA